MIRTRTRIQTRAALLAAASMLAASLLGHGLSAAPAYSPDNQESAFLGLINDYRSQNGLAPLFIQDELGAAADYHSQDMATHNYFDHYLSDGSGPGDNISAFGYTGDTWGENIAAGMATAKEALVGWQNSPSHNAAMLDPDYSEIGIGRFYDAGSEYGWYWTTTFGGGEDDAQSSSSSPSNRAQPQTTTNIDTSTERGIDGSGDGIATTTVNGRPVRGGTIVDANGDIVTTIGNNGETPIEKTTTIHQQPTVSNGPDWIAPAPTIPHDSYSAVTDNAGDSYGGSSDIASDSYAEDSYTAAESIAGGDDSYTSADDSYAASDSYDTGEDTYASDDSASASDSYDAETLAAADSYASDSYNGDSYDSGNGSSDSYDGEMTFYQQTIEAEQDGVIAPPTVNGVPVESGTYIADGNSVRSSNRNANANGDGPTVVYGDIDGGNAPTSINADGGYNSGPSGATTTYPNSGSSSNPTNTTTVTSPDGSMTTTTTINGVTMNDGISTTYGNSRGRGASASPGDVTYGN